jgi:hypothetical protein
MVEYAGLNKLYGQPEKKELAFGYQYGNGRKPTAGLDGKKKTSDDRAGRGLGRVSGRARTSDVEDAGTLYKNTTNILYRC